VDNNQRPCDTCGRHRKWHKRASTTCRDCLEIERHVPDLGEPFTGAWTHGLIRRPIKEHA
jgi:hypothetical protein